MSRKLKVDHFVYAILCSNGSVYIGLTKDLKVRWKQHVKGIGAQWTKRYQPVKMFYTERVKGTLKKAMARERKLKKSTGRKMLKKILQTASGGMEAVKSFQNDSTRVPKGEL